MWLYHAFIIILLCCSNGMVCVYICKYVLVSNICVCLDVYRLCVYCIMLYISIYVQCNLNYPNLVYPNPRLSERAQCIRHFNITSSIDDVILNRSV